MAEMRVKDLIKILQEIDPELPLHKRGSAGDYPQIDSDYLGYYLDYGRLMRSKNDPSYITRADDPVWKNNRDQFNEEFDAVVFD